MSFWHSKRIEHIDLCGFDDGDIVILLTSQHNIVLAEVSHDWHLATMTDPNTGEEYTDEICEYYLKEYGGYDSVDTEDILCWALMSDLYKFLPAEFALDGSPDIAFVVTYKRGGKTERRLFYEREDVRQFLESCREHQEPEIELDNQLIESFYMDKCEE